MYNVKIVHNQNNLQIVHNQNYLLTNKKSYVLNNVNINCKLCDVNKCQIKNIC